MPRHGRQDRGDDRQPVVSFDPAEEILKARGARRWVPADDVVADFADAPPVTSRPYFALLYFTHDELATLADVVELAIGMRTSEFPMLNSLRTALREAQYGLEIPKP
jgi:hypothetical protein